MSSPDAQFYVSMKGVVITNAKVLLLRKQSGNWDLPGGRLGMGEKPKQCLIREVHEETGLIVKPKNILYRWVRHRPENVDVFLVSHLCPLSGSTPTLMLSHEHTEADWFSESGLPSVSKGIRASIKYAYRFFK